MLLRLVLSVLLRRYLAGNVVTCIGSIVRHLSLATLQIKPPRRSTCNSVTHLIQSHNLNFPQQPRAQILRASHQQSTPHFIALFTHHITAPTRSPAILDLRLMFGSNGPARRIFSDFTPHSKSQSEPSNGQTLQTLFRRCSRSRGFEEVCEKRIAAV